MNTKHTPPKHSWRNYLLATLACGVTTLLASPLVGYIDLANIVMLFLLTVVSVAVYLGRRAAIAAAFISVGLFDFFFVSPRFSLAVSDIQYLLTFAVMLIVALIIGHLSTQQQQQAQLAQEQDRQSRGLYELARHLAGAVSQQQVLAVTQQYLHELLAADAFLFIPDATENLYCLDHPYPPDHLAQTLAVATVYESGEAIQTEFSDRTPHVQLLLPLKGTTRMRGILVVSVCSTAVLQLQQHRPLLEGIASLVVTALERLHFVQVAQQTQLQIVSERLRSSILAALSHDIRTPLTALYGLADTLTLHQPPLPTTAQEIAVAMRDQAMQLNNMVSKLLDMARLQSGQITLRKEWQPLEEVIGASIKLLGMALAQHPVKVTLPRDLPLLEFDAILLERVFCNLLENAAKYSPSGSAITLRAAVNGKQVEVCVCDHGPGFPTERLHKVFDLFERGGTESTVPGVGLGLAICRAIVDAHGGTIQAYNASDDGACVMFSLPTGQPPVIEVEPSVDTSVS